jgi:DNA-directed RNA polymerase subunit N (RpoN/RPB10)
MIIPVRCWTCGKVLGNKYETYKKLVAEDKSTNDETIINVTNVKKTAEGKALDKLGIKRYCCRNVMLSHVELIDII